MKKLMKNGLDAPLVPILYILAGLIALLFVAVFHQYDGYLWTIGYGVLMILGGVIFINTSTRGKKKIWSSIINSELSQSSYHVLDLGTGHASVLLQMSDKLSSTKKSMGIDIWNSDDQSNNGIEATEAIIQENDLAGQVDIKTADMRSLPSGDGEYDLVVSSLAFHNIKPKIERKRALLEAVRVLGHDGKLIIVDTGHNKREYAEVLNQAGMDSINVKTYGMNGWWTGPWMATYLVMASKKQN
ncbi:class I SAM-dependent methyltransferase [Weissella coleopterorum]|uniref:Class I SAM-dependent methyltransferase n=2 Tax=Weissella coleopterorum TaxID=2714949 RepID=A0A6G8AZC7_9LACO|nr:class I SAM-dependent methyltransferase [Weissella coleopterorum]